MAVHDDWARITPAELSFPRREAAEEGFEAIAEEARGRDVDPADPAAFVLLGEAGRTLRELRGPGDRAERLREHGLLLYHLFHAWRAGEPLYLLDTRVVRLLVESGPWEGAGPEPPGPAAYVQLPQHLVWVRTDGEGDVGGTPESVDGLFWTVWEDRVSFLLVMGIRPDRPGFGVVPLDPVPVDRLGAWTDTPMREEGEDFASSMPGAELERLYEVRTAGEVLKLGARTLRYLATAPDGARRVVEPEAPEEVDAEATSEASRPREPGPPSPGPGPGPRRSARPYVRVTLAP